MSAPLSEKSFIGSPHETPLLASLDCHTSKKSEFILTNKSRKQIFAIVNWPFLAVFSQFTGFSLLVRHLIKLLSESYKFKWNSIAGYLLGKSRSQLQRSDWVVELKLNNHLEPVKSRLCGLVHTFRFPGTHYGKWSFTIMTMEAFHFPK